LPHLIEDPYPGEGHFFITLTVHVLIDLAEAASSLVQEQTVIVPAIPPLTIVPYQAELLHKGDLQVQRPPASLILYPLVAYSLYLDLRDSAIDAHFQSGFNSFRSNFP